MNVPAPSMPAKFQAGALLSLLLTWACLILFFPLPPELSPSLSFVSLDQRTVALWQWPAALLVAGAVCTAGWRRRSSSDAVLIGGNALALLAAFSSLIDGSAIALCASLWWLFFLAVLALSDNEKQFLLQVCLYLFGAQILAALGAFGLGYHTFSTPRFGARAGGLLSSPNEIYPWSLIWCGFFFAAAKVQNQKWPRLVAWGGFAGSVAVLFLTFSRAGWVGFTLMLPSLIKGFSSKPWHRSVGYITILAVLLGAATVRTHGEILSPNNDGSTYGRVRIWNAFWELFKKKPLWGYGVGQIERNNTTDIDFVEPKNLYAQFALERGIVGVLIFCFFVSALWWKAKRLLRSGVKDTSVVFAAEAINVALPALLVAGLFDTPIFGHFERILPTISFLILAGIVAGADVAKAPPAILPLFRQQENGSKILHSPEKVAIALYDMQRTLSESDIPFFVIGSCARRAYLDEEGPIPDIDIVILEPDARRRARVLLQVLSEKNGVTIDYSLSRFFNLTEGAYFLVYGRMKVPVDPRVFEVRWVNWQKTAIPTFAPQTLLHFFNCLVATPLRPKDKPAVFRFARFVRSEREFSHDLLVPFHIFVARWRYLPLRALQLWWRRSLWRLHPTLRNLLLLRGCAQIEQ